MARNRRDLRATPGRQAHKAPPTREAQARRAPPPREPQPPPQSPPAKRARVRRERSARRARAKLKRLARGTRNREKLLDMRRMHGGQLSDIFDKLHPEYNWKNLPLGAWRMLWDESRRAEDEWTAKVTGGRYRHTRFCTGSPPAWFRRNRNRLYRARDREAMIRQLKDGDDVVLPRRRRDIRWLWW